jgi:arylsulfatase A-like enzyme
MRRFALLLLLAPVACGVPAPSSPARPPNVLICVADDWGWPHAGAYGCGWVKTPAFDRVAREGLLFERAYTPNAKCAPSRAILLTGRPTWLLEEAANHVCRFPSKFRTFPEMLGDAGWSVGFTGKGWGPGDPGGRQLTGRPWQSRTAPAPTSGISRNDYAANFRDFLDASKPGSPWCFWYGGLEPHRGYQAGSGPAADLGRLPAYWPDTPKVRGDLQDYAREVEHFDAHLGRMLALLEERGLLANTLVVVTSDNGPPFPRMKGQAYEASTHLPLALRWPEGIRAPGRRVDDFVSFIDLAPTLLDLAGLPAGAATGRTWRPIFESSAPDPARDHLLLGQERHDVGRPGDAGYPIRGIRQGDWLYLRNFEPERWPACNPETGYLNCDGGPTKTEILERRRSGVDLEPWRLCFGKRGAEELYDVKTDPDCMRDLSKDPGRTSTLTALRDRLFAELRAQGDPRLDGRGAIFDAYPYAEEPLRGYYEQWKAGRTPKAGWVNPGDFEPRPLD